MREKQRRLLCSSRSGRYIILYVLDCALSFFVIPICAVAAWTSMSYIVNKADDNLRIILIIACAIVHSCSHLFCKFIYRSIREFVTSPTAFYIVSKVYLYIFGFASIVIYGVVPEKELQQLPYADSIYENVAMLVIGFAILLAMKCRPYLADTGGSDIGRETTPEEVFLFPYRLFNFSWKKNKLLYIFDSIFSVLIVGTLVILVWRGAWCLLDQIIFPEENQYELSGWTSLAIGYLIVFLTFVLQSVMKVLTRRYTGWKRLVILDLYVIISFCGTVNVWRGIWVLVEVYTKLEQSLQNCILLHFFSFLILVIFNSSNTLLVRGVYIDADESDDDSFEFPCYYFRLRFQEKQKEKVLSELNRANTLENDEVEYQLKTDHLMHEGVTEYIDAGSNDDDAGNHLHMQTIQIEKK